MKHSGYNEVSSVKTSLVPGTQSNWRARDNSVLLRVLGPPTLNQTLTWLKRENKSVPKGLWSVLLVFCIEGDVGKIQGKHFVSHYIFSNDEIQYELFLEHECVLQVSDGKLCACVPNRTLKINGKKH